MLQAQAAGVNIRVVNDSATFFGTAFSQALSDEIDLLGQHNILFVTAAGNTGDDNDDPSVRRYPCGYNRPTEICVTASDQNDTLPSWANYGATTVDLAAPGDEIYSTLRNGTYGYVNGGSMASPQVAGAAALILSVGDLSTAALKAQILNNVDPVPALTGLVRTGGRLDICKAIPACASAPPRPRSHSRHRRHHRATTGGGREVQEEALAQGAQEVQEEGEPASGLANSRFGREAALRTETTGRVWVQGRPVAALDDRGAGGAPGIEQGAFS